MDDLKHSSSSLKEEEKMESVSKKAKRSFAEVEAA
jgi:hypothetical protein